ncbi:polyphosphate:AMP phosphotransferase [Polycladidibacter stylochi]|uniref:polyphosphate:AMP phosphotransferase n=1 Tax=Polycladidibacter stylochi TaxID=1807766 RepID=UPI00082D5028|nr:polyphosphate:AMP phosphotransferase [Pseudovibrio stylochi]
MFQSAYLPQKISKKEYHDRLPDLREKLLKVQHLLQTDKSFATIILLAGLDGAGKGSAIARLYEWMDSRYLACNAYQEPPTEEERLRPEMWRYWRDLPARGETAIVFGSWYQPALRASVMGKLSDDGLEHKLASINRFEEMLAHENVLLLKFWFTLPLEKQQVRLTQLKENKRNERHYLQEWSSLKNHRKAEIAGEKAALHTSTGYAPWFVIPSHNSNYRDLALAETIAESMSRKLDQKSARPVAAPAIIANLGSVNAVEAIDLSPVKPKEEYKVELADWQDKLANLIDSKAFKKRSLLCVFQGNDAAGKGGSIRRLTAPLDPRFYKVHPISAPTEEEKLHPYLWRFWRRIPKRGHTTIFDRSYYERVLVERVEGFCSEADWMRAYNEINSFERELADSGIIICKFWLAISEGEQLKRFKEREEVAYKNYKITEEDWRNRLRWADYAIAAGDMVDRTSTRYAPWTLVSSEDKRHARIEVLKATCIALENAMSNVDGLE